MKPLKAVIFDVYRTLLEVDEPADDAGLRWTALHEEFFPGVRPPTLEELSKSCRRFVDADHDAAHAVGVAHPEVQWPAVLRRALPALARVDPVRQAEFHLRHIRLLRTLRLARGAEDVVQECRRRGLILGIASNAQAYTLRELDDLLGPVGLGLWIFEPSLCFWSFENGFSKPDPLVFRILSARLEARGIAPDEALMVGDRIDNDIEPSRAQGFQTWWINETPEGNWEALTAARFSSASKSHTA